VENATNKSVFVKMGDVRITWHFGRVRLTIVPPQLP